MAKKESDIEKQLLKLREMANKSNLPARVKEKEIKKLDEGLKLIKKEKTQKGKNPKPGQTHLPISVKDYQRYLLMQYEGHVISKEDYFNLEFAAISTGKRAKSFEIIPLGSPDYAAMPFYFSVRKLSIENGTITGLKINRTILFTTRDISELKGIKLLDLRANQLEELNGLEKLTQLKSAYFSNNKIKSAESLRYLSELRTLYIDGNQISSLKSLAGLTNLVYANFSNNPLSSFTGITNLTNIEVLDVSNTNIKSCKGLKGLKKMRVLNLDNTQISDPYELKDLIYLRELYLRNTPLSKVAGFFSKERKYLKALREVGVKVQW